MNKNYKISVITLFSIAAILIITGLALTLKDLMKEEELLNVADDPDYYKIVFNLNGATSIENKVSKCKINNNSCSIILPNATKEDGVVLGYSANKDDTMAQYKIGDKMVLEGNIELYVISFKNLSLTIDKNDVDYLETGKLYCKIYNLEKECSVTVPNFNKVGYENKGYSTSRESVSGFKFPGDEYVLTKDTTLYPIYSTSARKKSLSVGKTFTYQNSFIEVENGCSEKITKEYLKYLDEIKVHSPYLLLGNKIAFVTDKTFDEIWGTNYVGMNYGPKSLRSVDIRCSENSLNDFYATMVHEMAHSWDFYYASKFGDNISSQSDIINLYNKYKVNSNRPFRDYSYSSIYEFIADMMRYYYFKYEVPRGGFSGLTYPNDLKKSLERYICVSKNDYNESKCSL
jgi:hypothetical protein